jgi:hypothetical protein
MREIAPPPRGRVTATRSSGVMADLDADYVLAVVTARCGEEIAGPWERTIEQRSVNLISLCIYDGGRMSAFMECYADR